MGCGASKGDSPPKNKVQPKDGKNKKNQKGNDKNKKENKDKKNNKTPRNNNNNKGDDDDGSVPDIVRGYPAPSPPKWKKKEVFKLEEMKEADKNAILAEVDADTTFEELGSRLTNGLKTELEKLRAVFMWMGLQNIDGQNYPNNVSEKKPLGAMKLLSQKKLLDSAFFAQLCRGAKLPCVIVRGHVKGVSYEIGNDSTGYSSWNAVYVDGSWQIIHPMWSFSGVSGHDTGKWTQIESEGKGTRQKGKANQGVKVRHIIQTYFLPNPEEFIYLCMAEKPEWQLVKNPWDREKFLNVPNFNMEYFTSDYKLKSENKGILSSEKGMLEMEFEERENSKSQLSYKLFFDEDNSKEKLPSDVDLPRTVFYETNGNQLRLVIRFHVVGIYRLDIVSSTSGELGSFRLDAKEKSDNDDMFPANPPVGFGFGHTAKDSGLDNPSHTGGLVVIQKNKKETFKFKLKKKTTIISKLRHNEIDPKDLEKFLEQKVDGKNVTLEVKIPEDAEEGDFALQVYKESESEENNVLNYLLTNKKEDFESSKGQVRKRIRGERARMHLRLALEDDDMGYLERSIAAFEREKLKDTDGDLKKARQKLAKMKKERKGKMEIAELKKNLKKAMKEKNLDDLEAAIEEAEESGHPELYNLIDKAKDLAKELETKEVEEEDEKYLRNLLKKAIEERKKEGLEEAIVEYDAIWRKHKVEDEEDEPWKKTPRKKKKPSALDKEYSRARELLVELYEDDVEEAMSENDCFGIQTVLDDSDRSIVSRELAQSEVMERARRYLQQEKRLRRYLSPILALKKSTVAEINTYRDPMPVTHDVMKATLITLGDQPREVANWKDIQRYLNPSGGILSRIKRFKIDMLRYRSADRAERLLINYTTNDVREASAGVAAFYQWSNNMIEEAKEHGSEADDDEKDRKEKEEKDGDKGSENGSKGGKGNNKNNKGAKKGQNNKSKQKNEKSNAKGKKIERKKDEEENEEDKKGDKSARDDKDKKEEKTPRKKGDRKKDEDEKDEDRKGDKTARDEDTEDGKTPRKKGDKKKDEDKKGDKSAREEKDQKVGKSPRKEEKTPRKRDESPRKDDKEKKDDKPTKDDKEKPKVTKEKTVNRGNKDEKDDKDKKDEKGKKYSKDEKGRNDEKDAKEEKGKKDDKNTKDDKGKKDDKNTKDEKGKKDDRYTKDDKGKKDDRYTKDEKEEKDDRYTKDDKGKKDDRYTKDDKGKKDDRYTKDEKGKKDDRYTKDEKGKKDDRYTKDDKGKKDDKNTKDEKGKKDDRYTKDEKGKKDDRYTKDEKGKKDDRYTKDDKGKKDDRYTKDDKDKKGDKKDSKSSKTDEDKNDKDNKKTNKSTKDAKKDDKSKKDDKDENDDKTGKTGKSKKQETEKDKKDGKARDPDKDKKAGRDKR